LVKPGSGGDLVSQRGGDRGELATLGPHEIPVVSAGPVEQGHLQQQFGADVTGMADRPAAAARSWPLS
jgi:hypothetical protein